MSADWEERLIVAFRNIEGLVPTKEFREFIEDTIRIASGFKGDEEDMPRGKKKTTAAPAATTSAPTVPTSVSVPSDSTALITEWRDAATQLAFFKEKEHTLRQALVAKMFDGSKLEGSETVEIGWGYKLRVTKEMDYAADNKNQDNCIVVRKMLEERGATDFAANLFRTKYEVAKKIYRDVLKAATEYKDEAIIAALHAAITLKPGMPQLEMIAPEPVQQQLPVEPVTFTPPTETPLPPAVPTWTGVIEEDFTPE